MSSILKFLCFVIQVRQSSRERADLDKRLHHKEEEFVKLDGRLQSALKEKTSLCASVGTLEKELLAVKKSNEHLKTKVNA